MHFGRKAPSSKVGGLSNGKSWMRYETYWFYFQAEEVEDLGIDSDDTRPIVMDQLSLTQAWKRKTRRLKKAMIIVGTVTAIVAFGLATYFIVHLLKS